jgi:hypothetical protein
LNQNKTIRRQEICGYRTELLASTILLASEQEKLTEQIVLDVYDKAVEESNNVDKEVVGTRAVNLKIIKGFFDYQEPKKDGADLSRNSDVISLIHQVLNRIDAIENKVGKSNRIAKVAASIEEQVEKVEMHSMRQDGKCLYWFLANVEALLSGKKASELENDKSLLSAVKAQIIEHGMAIRDILDSQGKNVVEEWFKMVGEPIDLFYEKVTNKQKLGQKERHGGHVEAMLHGWRTRTAVTIVNADAITSQMSDKEVSQQVFDMPWPEDSRDQVENAVIAVCSDNHYYLMVRGEQGVFKLGEEYQSVLKEGLALIKSQVEAIPGFDDIGKVTDKKRRLEMIKERIAAPRKLTVTKAKTNKRSRKKGGSGNSNSGGGGGGSGGSSGSGAAEAAAVAVEAAAVAEAAVEAAAAEEAAIETAVAE